MSVNLQTFKHSKSPGKAALKLAGPTTECRNATSAVTIMDCMGSNFGTAVIKRFIQVDALPRQF